MNFEYDTDIYPLDQFWINEEVTYTELDYSSTVLDRQLSFCCSSNFTANSVPVNIYLGGNNEQAYILSATSFTINIVSNSTTTP